MLYWKTEKIFLLVEFNQLILEAMEVDALEVDALNEIFDGPDGEFISPNRFL